MELLKFNEESELDKDIWVIIGVMEGCIESVNVHTSKEAAQEDLKELYDTLDIEEGLESESENAAEIYHFTISGGVNV